MPDDFKQFFAVFSGHNPKPLLNMIGTSLGATNARRRIGNYLIKSVLQSYNGEYNPHSLTGRLSSEKFTFVAGSVSR